MTTRAVSPAIPGQREWATLVRDQALRHHGRPHTQVEEEIARRAAL